MSKSGVNDNSSEAKTTEEIEDTNALLHTLAQKINKMHLQFQKVHGDLHNMNQTMDQNEEQMDNIERRDHSVSLPIPP